MKSQNKVPERSVAASPSPLSEALGPQTSHTTEPANTRRQPFGSCMPHPSLFRGVGHSAARLVSIAQAENARENLTCLLIDPAKSLVSGP